jgi:hypothetical protein
MRKKSGIQWLKLEMEKMKSKKVNAYAIEPEN